MMYRSSLSFIGTLLGLVGSSAGGRPLLRFVSLHFEDQSHQGRVGTTSQFASGALETQGFQHLDDIADELEIWTDPQSATPLIVQRTANQGLQTSGSFVGSGVDYESNAPVTVSLVETATTNLLHGYVLFKDLHYTIKSGPNGTLIEQRGADDYWDEEALSVDERKLISDKEIDGDTDLLPQLTLQDDRGTESDKPTASVFVVFPVDVFCLLVGHRAGCNADDIPQGQEMMDAFATSAIQLANIAYANSEIDFSLELAAAHRADWSAIGKAGPEQLVTLHRGRDFLSLRRKRDSLGADFMILLSALPSSCGLAYVDQDWNLAYGVVHVACIPNHSFTHEIAHSMGCDHNIEHAMNIDGYAFGYRAPTFRTIMAHKCAPDPCPRVAYFSNPDVFYQGNATGTEKANNALWIQEHRHVFPSYHVKCDFGWSWGWCLFARTFWQSLDHIVSWFYR